METNQTPLENEEIVVSNIELKEITKKDGGTFKQFNVNVPDAPKGTWYSLPIKKKDGSETKAYEVYKANKAKLDDYFVADTNIKCEIAYSEKVVEKEFEGTKHINRYRTIRALKIIGVAPVEVTAETEEDVLPSENDINAIPF